MCIRDSIDGRRVLFLLPVLWDTVFFQFELEIYILIVSRIRHLDIQAVEIGSQLVRSVSSSDRKVLFLVFQYIVGDDMSENHFLVERSMISFRFVGNKYKYILRA